MTLKTIKSMATKLGARVKDNSSGRWMQLIIWSPDGQCWQANGEHIVMLQWPDGTTRTDQNDEIRDVLNQMEMGTAPCEDSECETCYPDKEFEDDLR